MEIKAPSEIKTAEQGFEIALDSFKFLNKVDPTRVNSLRVSTFPFCSTKWLLNLPMALAGHREESFMDTFYTGMGTHIHTHVQHVLDSSPFVIRDWKCAKCGYRHTFCLHPRKCKGCGSTQAYFHPMEHEIRVGCVVGHIDDAFLTSNGIDIIDYKTTSQSSLQGNTSLPHPENVYQIEAYCAIKRRQGYDIKSWTLAYITRESAKRKYVTARQYYGHSLEDEYPRILKRLKGYVRDYKQVAGMTSVEEVHDVLARRRLSEKKKDPEHLCGFCNFRQLCPSTKKVTATAIRVFSKVKNRLPIYPIVQAKNDA